MGGRGEPERPAVRRAIVVMGVSGSGKTAVGARLAAVRGVAFVEGDDFHSAGNVRKIRAGTPLDDDDRRPWLDAIAGRIAAEPADGPVVACSALKRAYRDRLRRGAGRPVAFVFLHGTPALLAERIGARRGHFAPAGLLASQLATLEDPTGEPGVIAVDVAPPVAETVARVQSELAALDV